MRLLAPALGAILALVCLSACASGGQTSALVSPSVSVPQVLPKGAQPIQVSGQATTSDNHCTGSLPPSGPLPAPAHVPAGSYMAHIFSTGHLVAGVDQNTYLWGYRNPQTQQLEGFDIDMVKQVAIALFGDASPDHLQFKIIPNANRQAAVADGSVDLVAETMTVTCDRQNGKDGVPVDFSDVYYEAHQEVLVPRNSPITSVTALAGRRVCAAAGSTSLSNLKNRVPQAQLWEATNQTDCLVLLQQGQVDAISTDDTILQGLAAQDPTLTTLSGEKNQLSDEPYGMAISQKHPDFTRFVNAVLAQERADGVWQTICTKWLSSTLHSGTPGPTGCQD